MENHEEQSEENPPSSGTLPTERQVREQLKINGDRQETIWVWLPRVIVIIIVITIFVLKLALPNTFKSLTNQIAFQGSPASRNCNPTGFDSNKKVFCSNFTSSNPQVGLLARNLKPENQFVIFYFEFTMEESERSVILNQSVRIEAHQVVEVTYVETDKKQIFQKKIVYNESSDYFYAFQDLKGTGSRQDGKMYMHYLIPFAYDRVSVNQREIGLNLLIIAKFANFSQLQSTTLEIKGLTMSIQFTQFTIIVRGVYCFISLVTGIIFLRRYCQLNQSNRILEIRLVGFVSFMLIFFNDPFYAITVLKINPVTTFFSVFYAVNLFVFLIALWILFLRRIYYQPTEKETKLFKIKKFWPVVLVSLAIYTLFATLFLQYSYYIYERIPILVPSDLRQMKVVPTIVITALLLGAVVIYQIVMFIMIIYKQCRQENDTNRLKQRHRSYLVYYPFFLLMFIIFFAAGGAMPYSYDGAWILYGYSFMNIFIYILQYLYYTPVAQLDQQSQSKQNLNRQQLGNFSLDNKLKSGSANNQNMSVDQKVDE